MDPSWIARSFLPLCLFAGVATADVQPIDNEFSGSAVETWESFNPADVQALYNVDLPIFNGSAVITGLCEYIWITATNLDVPGSMGLGPFPAQSHDGVQGYGTSSLYGTSKITFSAPVRRFGGYWGSASTTVPITLSFFGPQGELIGTDNVFYTRPNFDGTLEWFGWETSAPVSRIEYAGSWVAQDSLRFDVVPEPTTIVILALASMGALRRKRHRNGPG